MSRVTASSLPRDALLRRYRRPAWTESVEPYTDSFVAVINHTVDIEQFVFAFYTTALFRAERAILKFAAKKPSTDEQARSVARGEGESFAAWSVEARNDTELLMCDFRERTRSWFMVERATATGSTLLRFGSAVVPVKNTKTGAIEMSIGFTMLLGFHKLYSRALLYAARRRLIKSAGSGR